MGTKTFIKFRLFVTDNTPSATRAVENLRALCDDPLIKNNYDVSVEVIDVDEVPDIAEEDKILVTPTLLKELPPPVRRVVGDLSSRKDVLVALDIDSHENAAGKASGNGT